MTIETGVKPGGKLKATLDQVVDLLNKQDLVSEFTSRQATPRHELLQSLLVKQQLAEVQRRIAQLHPADLAFVLEGLPLHRRHVVWDLVRPEARGAVLLELSDAVRARLIADMQENEILGLSSTSNRRISPIWSRASLRIRFRRCSLRSTARIVVRFRPCSSFRRARSVRSWFSMS